MGSARRTCAGLVVAATLIIAGCGSDGDGDGNAKGSPATASAGKDALTVAMSAQAFEGLDPQMQASPPTDSITLLMYETLINLRDGKLEPGLATEWRNPQPKLWELDLRDGVSFQDGASFDADAVVKSFKRMLDPKNERTRASEYANVASVAKVDADTVRFKLKQVWPAFPYAIAYTSGAIVSPKAAAEYGAKLDKHPAGTGPFRYEKSGADGSVTLAAFDGYWGEKAKVKRLKFVPVEADNTRLLMLKSGQADVISGLPASSLSQVESDRSLAVHSTPGGLVMHIGLNTTDKALGDPKVRQALNYAVDSGAIVDSLLAGKADVADSYLAKTTVGYRATDGYPYDPEKAKQLLAEAGYPNGFDLKVVVPSGRYPMAKETAEAVQGYLRAVGVKMTLDTMDFSAELEAITQPRERNKVQAFLLGWQAATGEPALVSNIVFHSKQFPPTGWNAQFYASDTADRLIDDAAVETDDAKRNELYGDLQETVVADAPWLFLYTPQNLLGAKADVSGLDTKADGTLLLHGIG